MNASPATLCSQFNIVHGTPPPSRTIPCTATQRSATQHIRRHICIDPAPDALQVLTTTDAGKFYCHMEASRPAADEEQKNQDRRMENALGLLKMHCRMEPKEVSALLDQFDVAKFLKYVPRR